MNNRKTILVAPLNWGLGHAARCIPIIKTLKTEGFTVIIASDGGALELLKKEFPNTTALELPEYKVSYTKDGSDLKKKLLASMPRFLKAIKAEHKALNHIIAKYAITGVISDNRLGLHTKKVPTVFITHQLTVLSGKTTWLSTFLHKQFIKRFDECWVPDYKGNTSLSGRLSFSKNTDSSIKYLGPLSRMKRSAETLKYKAIVILSGPEPQRTLLEEKLIKELKKYSGRVLVVQGILEEDQIYIKKDNFEIVNYLTTQELERAINRSEFVITRSGYTTIMDLACLGKKVFFIPTPGQTEQEYLAERLKQLGIAPFSSQETFKVKDLSKLGVYKGFTSGYKSEDLRQFFGLFEGKRELRANTKFTFDIDLLLVRFNNMFDNRKTEP